MCLLRHYFYIHRHQVRFWSSNGLNCFNFLLVRFNLPMIDLWSYKLAARWRRWTVNQYALRAWVRSSSMTSTFLWTPELSSVGTKTDVYLILLVLTKKLVRSQKIGERIGTQHFEVRLSWIVKQPNVEKFQVCSRKKLDGQCNTFCF